MTGGDVKRRREELQLSRPQLLDRLRGASISANTVGKLAGLECRNDEIPAAEVPAYRAALRLADDGSAVDEPAEERVRTNGAGRVRKPPVGYDPKYVSFEWCGLQPGDVVKVEGEPRAYFEFRWYFDDGEHEPFVHVFGGRRSHEKVRFFRPERIRTTRGRRVYVDPSGRR